MLWDTSGYAWYDDGRPRLVQRIKAELWENYKKVDDMTKNLKIVPKPIVFVPGIWTNPQDFEVYQNLLTTTHSYGWKTYRTIDVSNQGTINQEGTVRTIKTNKTVYDNADNLDKYVNNVRQELNAWHVDMLAHSTGGLVARLYIHKQMEVLPDNYPVVKHLMMFGSPNLGVPCADSMANNDAFKNNMQTAKELMPDEMAIFNKYVTQRKGTRFSALIGDSIPILCASPQWNDGFVSVESAKFGVEDFAITKSMHPNMINTKTFNDFVKPHVVTGPRATYPLPVVSEK
jgi:pimeloyl-ACP methyl ester carboxylesterase